MSDWSKVLGTLSWMVMTVYYMLEALVVMLLPRSYRRKDIRGNVALVTGGGSGIGRLMCLRLAAKGAIVVTWDVSQAGNEETVRQVVAAGGQCCAYTVDLCDRQAVYATAAKVMKEVGKVDILVNNAGIVTGKELLHCPDEHIVKTFEVNAISHFWTAKAFLPDMIVRNKGHIVTIASMAGKVPCNRLVDYCASKFAAVGFHDSLSLELKAMGKLGVKMTLVCPIFISTGMFEGASSRNTLKPEWVADEVVDGMLMNVSTLHMPKTVNISLWLRQLLPEKSHFAMVDALGLTRFMDNFVGRRKGV